MNEFPTQKKIRAGPLLIRAPVAEQEILDLLPARRAFLLDEVLRKTPVLGVRTRRTRLEESVGIDFSRPEGKMEITDCRERRR